MLFRSSPRLRLLSSSESGSLPDSGSLSSLLSPGSSSGFPSVGGPSPTPIVVSLVVSDGRTYQMLFLVCWLLSYFCPSASLSILKLAFWDLSGLGNAPGGCGVSSTSYLCQYLEMFSVLVVGLSVFVAILLGASCIFFLSFDIVFLTGVVGGSGGTGVLFLG